MPAILNLKESAAAAVRALQKWYEADPYAQSTGLYHFDDPDLAHDAGGSAAAGLIVAAGYRNTFQDMVTWWNSANAITAVIDYMLVTDDHSYISVIEDTFNKGQNAWQPNIGRIVGWTAVVAAAGATLGYVLCGPGGPACAVIWGFFAGLVGASTAAATTIGRDYMTDFYGSDPFYDDAGWWALAWIKAYDLTGDQKYLNMAATIFSFMTGGWDEACNGGLYWQQNKNGPSDNAPYQAPYKNAIANELFLAVAAGLCLRFGKIMGQNSSTVQTYKDWANKEWQWFSKCGLINEHLTYDALNQCAQDLTEAVWSYNQGVILGALCDLYEITGDNSLLNTAEQLADGFIANPVSASSHQSGVNTAGILTEFNDSNNNYDTVGIDPRQFKGIFIRNLARLWASGRGKSRYRSFILKNAASALAHKNSSFQFGASWSAPLDTADFVRQTSAVDLLNAAVLVQYRDPDTPYLTPLLLADLPPGAAMSWLAPLSSAAEPEVKDLSYLDPLLLKL